MLGYLIVAVLSATGGLLLGGLMAGGKVSDLYDRIAAADENIRKKNSLIEDLKGSLNSILDYVENKRLNSIDSDILSTAHVLIAKCDS